MLLARIVNASGSYITQASLTAIKYMVRDIDGESSGTLTTLTVSAVVFDTLQTGGAWDADSVGYNFATTIPASAFAWTPTLDERDNQATRHFQVDVRFTPTSGEQWVVPFDLTIWPTWITG